MPARGHATALESRVRRHLERRGFAVDAKWARYPELVTAVCEIVIEGRAACHGPAAGQIGKGTENE